VPHVVKLTHGEISPERVHVVRRTMKRCTEREVLQVHVKEAPDEKAQVNNKLTKVQL
jgi:hypothetical protein